jgi:hypothetical protein
MPERVTVHASDNNMQRITDYCSAYAVARRSAGKTNPTNPGLLGIVDWLFEQGSTIDLALRANLLVWKIL